MMASCGITIVFIVNVDDDGIFWVIIVFLDRMVI